MSIASLQLCMPHRLSVWAVLQNFLISLALYWQRLPVYSQLSFSSFAALTSLFISPALQHLPVYYQLSSHQRAAHLTCGVPEPGEDWHWDKHFTLEPLKPLFCDENVKLFDAFLLGLHSSFKDQSCCGGYAAADCSLPRLRG